MIRRKIEAEPQPVEAPKPEAKQGMGHDALMLSVAKIQAETISNALKSAVGEVVKALGKNAPAEAYTFTIQYDSSGKPTGMVARRGKATP